MAKKYSEIEELGEIRDRLVAERDDLKKRLDAERNRTLNFAESLIIEGNDLLGRLQQIKIRIRGLGYDVPSWKL